MYDAAKTTVIGRNMGRVESVGRLLGVSDNLYGGWRYYEQIEQYSKPLAVAFQAVDDGGWLIGKLRQGFTVIDIGLSAVNSAGSIYYSVEKAIVTLWETRNIWKILFH